MPTSEPLSLANKELLIDVDSLSVRFGAETVIDRISFCIHKGEFIGLIGPNGAGKTTLLKSVLGLLQPTSGKVKKGSATIGYIPQRGAQYNALVPISVLEVVRLGAGGSKETAMRALQDVHMASVAHKRFNELSGGQQQRIFIAKALAGNTDILMLDEPATGIDERSQAEFYALLQSLHQKGITIVMVSHEVDTVLTLVTRVICINHAILYDGRPQHFEADEYMPSYYKARHLKLHHHHQGAGHA